MNKKKMDTIIQQMENMKLHPPVLEEPRQQQAPEVVIIKNIKLLYQENQRLQIENQRLQMYIEFLKQTISTKHPKSIPEWVL